MYITVFKVTFLESLTEIVYSFVIESIKYLIESTSSSSRSALVMTPVPMVVLVPMPLITVKGLMTSTC